MVTVVGWVLFIAGVLCLLAGRAAFLIQGRRRFEHGVAGDTIRPKPTTLLITAILVGLALMLVGGVLAFGLGDG